MTGSQSAAGTAQPVGFWQVLAGRRSVRAFARTKNVSNEQIQQLLQAAIAAPSAGNMQPWFFYVVRDLEVRQRLAQAAWGQDFVAEASVAIVVCAEPERSARRYGERGRELYCLQDTAAATENILLTAVALDLAACWVGAFDEAAAAQALHLPPTQRPVAILPIGHPAESPSRRPRRPLSEVSRTV
jgi:nitroreductase